MMFVAAMRVIIPLLAVLLVPVALAAFPTQSGTLHARCYLLHDVDVGVFSSHGGCSYPMTFAADATSGSYYADLSWVPAEPWIEVSACLSTVRYEWDPVGATFSPVTLSETCGTGAGAFSLSVPASAQDEHVWFEIAFDAYDSGDLGVAAHPLVQQDVDWVVGHVA